MKLLKFLKKLFWRKKDLIPPGFWERFQSFRDAGFWYDDFGNKHAWRDQQRKEILKVIRCFYSWIDVKDGVLIGCTKRGVKFDYSREKFLTLSGRTKLPIGCTKIGTREQIRTCTNPLDNFTGYPSDFLVTIAICVNKQQGDWFTVWQ